MLRRCPGPTEFFTQFAEAANCLAVDHPAVLDDGRDLLWMLEDSDVGDGIAVPNDDVSKLARRDYPDLAGQVDHGRVTAGIGQNRLHRRHADFPDEQFRFLAVPPAVGESGGVARITAAQYRDTAGACVADHLKAGDQLHFEAIAHSVAKPSRCGTVLDPDPGRGQNRRDRHPSLGDNIEVVLARKIAVVDQINTGLGGSAGRGRAARVDRNLYVVPVGFVDDRRDLVIGDRLHIAPGRISDLDQVDPAFALLAGLADELVTRIAQDTCRIGRGSLRGRVGVGIENAAVIAQRTTRDDHARASKSPPSTASRTVTSVNHLPPGTAMLVTPARSTRPIAYAAQRVQNSALEVYLTPGNAPWCSEI